VAQPYANDAQKWRGEISPYKLDERDRFKINIFEVLNQLALAFTITNILFFGDFFFNFNSGDLAIYDKNTKRKAFNPSGTKEREKKTIQVRMKT